MTKEFNFEHKPVLLKECIDMLQIQPLGCYVDGTCGGGGHSAAILERLDAGGMLISIDRDRMAIEATKKRLNEVETNATYHVIQGEFADVVPIVYAERGGGCDGILLDLGVSSAQLDIRERGFSYSEDGPLDMRMNPSKGKSASELVADLSEEELVKILKDYGEERYAKRIVKAIVKRRKEAPFLTTKDLAEVVINAMPSSSRKEKQHPAKRTFQALRIAVNEELDQLEHFLDTVMEAMKPGGRICVISFHSLEDRKVKQAMRKWEDPCRCPANFPICKCGGKPLGKAIGRKGIVADKEEVAENPRARSARLRVFELVKKERPLLLDEE